MQMTSHDGGRGPARTPCDVPDPVPDPSRDAVEDLGVPVTTQCALSQALVRILRLRKFERRSDAEQLKCPDNSLANDAKCTLLSQFEAYDAVMESDSLEARRNVVRFMLNIITD